MVYVYQRLETKILGLKGNKTTSSNQKHIINNKY